MVDHTLVTSPFSDLGINRSTTRISAGACSPISMVTPDRQDTFFSVTDETTVHPFSDCLLLGSWGVINIRGAPHHLIYTVIYVDRYVANHAYIRALTTDWTGVAINSYFDHTL
jgi:hypothetical protein